ncbi:MAG TPA: hypothetical protein VF465_20540 [Flavobacterium sp.]|uniref:hypothetical protein n=1 Tax=Flavobacterium sp. TaxID=239 RepID=UPI002ED20F66
MTTENKIRLKRIYGFIIIYGLICGLVLSFNLWLINFISYLAIYTNLIFIFLIFLFFIRAYKLVFGIDIKVVPSLIIGLPVFLIGLAIFKFFYDFGSTTYYTEYGKQELIKEWFGYAAVMTAILTFIFLPIYNWKRRNKKYSIESE